MSVYHVDNNRVLIRIAHMLRRPVERARVGTDYVHYVRIKWW